MRYALVLSALGAVLFYWAYGIKPSYAWLLIWLAMDSIVLGASYAIGFHYLFGKSSEGTLPFWSKVVFFPFHILVWVTWHGYRLTSREGAWHSVTNNLVIGRRLLPGETPGQFENFVDLTAEFEEPTMHRTSAGYQCIPLLDGSAPKAVELLASIKSLKPGRTYIHCAQGHGRTGLFALALLLADGTVKSVPEGLALIKQKRPKVALNSDQLKTIQDFARLPEIARSA